MIVVGINALVAQLYYSHIITILVDTSTTDMFLNIFKIVTFVSIVSVCTVRPLSFIIHLHGCFDVLLCLPCTLIP